MMFNYSLFISLSLTPKYLLSSAHLYSQYSFSHQISQIPRVKHLTVTQTRNNEQVILITSEYSATNLDFFI